MKDIFTAAAVTPEITLADPIKNAQAIIEEIKKAEAANVSLLVFPELCITGYTAGDLFFSSTLLEKAREALSLILQASEGIKMLVFVGMPLSQSGKVYNTAAVLCDGKLLAFIPKTHLPNYGEFQEVRYFAAGHARGQAEFMGELFPFGTDIVFTAQENEMFRVACEICEDIWAIPSPGERHALAGANVIVNLSASTEFIGKQEKRKTLISSLTSRAMCAYVYANAGKGESTSDTVFTGHNLIFENGALLAESNFSQQALICDIDLGALEFERRKDNTFLSQKKEAYLYLPFSTANCAQTIYRQVSPMPFLNQDISSMAPAIFKLQTEALKKRLSSSRSDTAVIGVSGGLDSTLVLLVSCAAARELDLKKGVTAVTMPGLGTGGRTYKNAKALCESLHVRLREIPISAAIEQHLCDIAHSKKPDSAFENAQARERTQILMDIANMENGLVIGTGDMSELALGWATYNGDQMSMYGVNASLPKTLLKEMIRYFAQTAQGKLKETLLDIVDTEISPELLPAKKGEMVQKTESIIGPYELHDFFLYYMLGKGFSPSKLFLYAKHAFKDAYSEKIILKWMRVFYSRFFSQQFKRTAMPDGVKLLEISLSPRGDLKMVSDVQASVWLEEIDELSR